MLRGVAGVVLGYLTFAVLAVLVFMITGHKPHDPFTPFFGILSIAWGVGAAVLAGFVSVSISRGPRTAWVVAGIIALGAVTSMFGSEAAGTRWSQIAALVLMAPSALIGGRLAARRLRPS